MWHKLWDYIEYNVEISEGRQLLRRDGTIVQAAMKVMKVDDDSEPRG